MLDKKDMVQWIWKRDDSVVNELLQCLAPHLSKETMADFTQSIAKHAPHDLGANLMQSLLWYIYKILSLNDVFFCMISAVLSFVINRDMGGARMVPRCRVLDR